MSTSATATAMMTGCGLSVRSIASFAEIPETTRPAGTSSARGASMVGPSSAMGPWNGPSCCVGRRSLTWFRRGRASFPSSTVEVGGASADVGAEGSLWGGDGRGSGAGSGVGIWATAGAQTSSASSAIQTPHPTLTAVPGDTTATPTPDPTLHRNSRRHHTRLELDLLVSAQLAAERRACRSGRSWIRTRDLRLIRAAL